MSEATGRYTLKVPIPAGDAAPTLADVNAGNLPGLITEVVMRRACVGDLRVMDAKAGEIAKGAALISRLSGLKPAVVDRIDAEDFEALCGLAGSALTGGASTV